MKPSSTSQIPPGQDQVDRQQTYPASRRGYDCCSRPHGNFAFSIALITTAAFILSLYAHFSCRFLVRDLITEDADGGQKVASAFSIGIWFFMDPEDTYVCFYYPSGFVFDSSFMTSRAMAPLAACLGGIVMITLWFSTCMGIPRGCWLFCATILLLVTLFEGLTFLLFQSNMCGTFNNLRYECHLGQGGKCGVAAIVLWFVAAVGLCFTDAPEETMSYYPDADAVTRIETIRPDGTKVVETRTVHYNY